MSLQARASQWDHRLYNVNRDVAHNFQFVAAQVADRLEDRRWPFLAQWLDDRGVTMDDLGEACKAGCLFAASTTADANEDMAAALERSGWSKVKEPAKAAYCAMIGTVLLGMFFTGSREAVSRKSDGTVQTPMSMEELIAAGDRAAALCRLSPFGRALLRLKLKVKAAMAAFSGAGPAAAGEPQPVDPKSLRINAGGSPPVDPKA